MTRLRYCSLNLRSFDSTNSIQELHELLPDLNIADPSELNMSDYAGLKNRLEYVNGLPVDRTAVQTKKP